MIPRHLIKMLHLVSLIKASSSTHPKNGGGGVKKKFWGFLKNIEVDRSVDITLKVARYLFLKMTDLMEKVVVDLIALRMVAVCSVWPLRCRDWNCSFCIRKVCSVPAMNVITASGYCARQHRWELACDQIGRTADGGSLSSRNGKSTANHVKAFGVA